MLDARHSGRTRRDDSNCYDFTNPEHSDVGRSATHRYFPVEKKVAEATATAGRGDEFSSLDFKARWWPAPDVEK